MKKISIISPDGLRDIRIVMFLRLAVACAMAVVLSVLASLFGSYLDHANTTISVTQKTIVAVTVIFVGMAAFSEIFYGGYAARKEEKRIRHTLLQRFFGPTAPTKDSRYTDTSRLIALMTDNAERVTEYRQVYFGPTKAALLIPFLILTYEAIFIDWVIGGVLLIFCPVIPLTILGFMKLFRSVSAQSRSQRATLSAKYLDAIRNLVTIRLMGAGPRIEKELKEQGEKNRWAIMRLLAGNQIVIIIMDGAFSLLLICAAALLAVIRFHAEAITSGEALSVVFLSVLLLEPLLQVAGFFYIGMGGKASERAIARYMQAGSAPAQTISEDTAPDAALPLSPVDSTIASKTSPSDTKEDSTTQCSGASEFVMIQAKNLRYDYGRGPIFDGISFDVRKGSTCAIIGRSGGGKSTLMSLMRAQLPVQQGSLTIAGQTMTPSNCQLLRHHIAFVPQKTWLFTGSVKDNLLIAQPQASDDELWRALDQANIAKEICSMPDQLETDVGEQGTLISGGQAQRLSLARAFLSQREILLLDEPTSQVDIESERQLIDAIGSIGNTRTVVVVTHRYSLLCLADTIYELTDGRLIPRSKQEIQGNNAAFGEDDTQNQVKETEETVVLS
ncbi:MAG: ATP-binding cassette domain-containing protein [Actinomycetaceae bacterium]|nr:ATP-binding cassette domain-containing protein [Actinomycetaceae bacterium]